MIGTATCLDPPPTPSARALILDAVWNDRGTVWVRLAEDSPVHQELAAAANRVVLDDGGRATYYGTTGRDLRWRVEVEVAT